MKFLMLMLMFVASKLYAENSNIVYISKKNEVILVECKESQYKLLPDKDETIILKNELTPNDKQSWSLIFNGDLTFNDYYRVLDHMNRIGYKELKVFVASKDKVAILPIEIKALGGLRKFPSKSMPQPNK